MPRKTRIDQARSRARREATLYAALARAAKQAGLQLLKLKAHHPGWPDHVLNMGNGVAVWLESKTGTKLRKEQKVWLWEWTKGGGRAYWIEKNKDAVTVYSGHQVYNKVKIPFRGYLQCSNSAWADMLINALR